MDASISVACDQISVSPCLSFSWCRYLARSLLTMTLTKAFPPPPGQTVLVRPCLIALVCLLTCATGSDIQPYRLRGCDHRIQNLPPIEGTEAKTGCKRLFYDSGFMWCPYMLCFRCDLLDARCPPTTNECRIRKLQPRRGARRIHLQGETFGEHPSERRLTSIHSCLGLAKFLSTRPFIFPRQFY